MRRVSGLFRLVEDILDSLELAAKPWMTAASTMREAEVLASWSGGSVSGNQTQHGTRGRNGGG